MNIKKIKKLILSQRETVKNLLLTEHQLGVIKFIESCEEVTSGDIVLRYECSIQGATATLTLLKSKGWLSREERTAPSGGMLFVYKVNLV